MDVVFASMCEDAAAVEWQPMQDAEIGFARVEDLRGVAAEPGRGDRLGRVEVPLRIAAVVHTSRCQLGVVDVAHVAVSGVARPALRTHSWVADVRVALITRMNAVNQ